MAFEVDSSGDLLQFVDCLVPQGDNTPAECYDVRNKFATVGSSSALAQAFRIAEVVHCANASLLSHGKIVVSDNSTLFYFLSGTGAQTTITAGGITARA